jgi:hypothetical protein
MRLNGRLAWRRALSHRRTTARTAGTPRRPNLMPEALRRSMDEPSCRPQIAENHHRRGPHGRDGHSSFCARVVRSAAWLPLQPATHSAAFSSKRESIAGISTSIQRVGAFSAGCALSNFLRRSSAWSNISCGGRVGSFPARNCLTPCGGGRRGSTSAPSTYASVACAGRCRRDGSATQSAPCEG